MSDLISREAAIAAACKADSLELATEGQAAIIARLRALPPAQEAAPAVKVKPDIEAAARQIYASMVFANQLERATEKEAAWVEGGNSLVQQEARSCAYRILSAMEGGEA